MILSPRTILVATLALFLCSALLLAGATTNSNAGAFALASPAAPASSVTWGPDINVGGGAQSTRPQEVPDAYVRHKNQDISVDPTDPNHITAAYASVEFGSSSLFANSTDGGLTWARGVFTDMQGMMPSGDVNFAYGRDGVGYYTSAALGYPNSGLFVLTTTDGLTWNSPNAVLIYGNDYSFYNTTLAIDNRPSGKYNGSLYLYWQYNNSVNEPYYEGIWGAFSRDGGATWSTPAQVSGPDHYYSYGPDTQVAPDGSVYVAFEFRPSNVVTSTRELYLNRSTDGGLTWGGDKMISGAPVQYIGGLDDKGLELTLPVERNNSCSLIRITQYPTIAVSPTDPNTVYAVWNDGRWDTPYLACGDLSGYASDIAFSKTTDAGNTWTAPARINDDPVGNSVDQFQPTIQVSPSGTIGVTWYDRRYDPIHANYDLAYTESTDGGATWSLNQRVSDVSSNPDELLDYKGICDIGYRKSLVYGPDYAMASWIDTRVAPQLGEFFVDRGTINTPTVCTLQFEDVLPGSTFYPYVRCLACKGILSGYPCGGVGEPCNPTNDPYFRPNNNITRGQIAKVVSNAAGFNEPVSGQTFEDVLPGSTFYPFIERLATRGVMSGYPCGGTGEPCGPNNLPYFRPHSNATRGQISEIVAIAANIQDPPGTQIFEDVQPGSTFFTYTQQLANLGVMSGYPCGNAEPCVPPGDRPYFRPHSNATRGQTSKIVSNTFFPICTP